MLLEVSCSFSNISVVSDLFSELGSDIEAGAPFCFSGISSCESMAEVEIERYQSVGDIISGHQMPRMDIHGEES